ncbi:MAG: hypothetical protein AAF805_11140 [Planctomycetota bacterium]
MSRLFAMRGPSPIVVQPEAGDDLFVPWAITLAALVRVTTPLWLPLRDAPRVAPLPALEFSTASPIAAGVGCLGLAAGAALLARPGMRAVAAITAAIAFAMAFDQLRWQPWAWHTVIAGVAMATLTPDAARRWLRAVAIAVYAFSAIAKLDASFAWTLGQQMLGVLLGAVGIDIESLDDRTRTAAAASLPAGELLLATLLAASLRWRRLAWPACAAAAAMHATTVGVLGPWALGHSAGVLLWNVGFAWQTVVLFRPTHAAEGERIPSAAHPVAWRFGVAVCLLGVAAPMGTPMGWWDQWPGWALYAPGGERATLFVHAAAVDRLPESLRPHVAGADTDPAEGPWRRVALDDWVLAETRAPIYPQNRIVAAIGASLVERFALTGRVLVRVESAANRWNGRREGRTLAEASEMRSASELAGVRPAVVWPD